MLASLLFLVGSGAVLGVAVFRRGAGVPAYCAVPVHDCGNVKAGSTLSHVFVVTNRSVVDVTQVRVVAGCSSCSSAIVDRSALPVGGALQVAVLADAGKTAGKIQRDFFLLWHCPGESMPRKTRLSVRASVSD